MMPVAEFLLKIGYQSSKKQIGMNLRIFRTLSSVRIKIVTMESLKYKVITAEKQYDDYCKKLEELVFSKSKTIPNGRNCFAYLVD